MKEINPFTLVNLEDLAKANATPSALGDALEKAFHDKSNPKRIRDLVNQGAPVNYRLDYGLEIRLESHFVHEFFLLLEGDQGEETFIENAKKIFKENFQGYVDYIKTGPEIYHILHDQNANQVIVPINENYIRALEEHAANGRANPYHKNSSLIIAAGLRDSALIEKLIVLGKTAKCDLAINGSYVNFIGFFEDTAAIWSAILLDDKSLAVLIKNGAEMENLGVTKSSLLHWIAVAVKMDPSEPRLKAAKSMTTMLIDHDINLQAENLLGKTAIDYATGEYKSFLSVLIQNRTKRTMAQTNTTLIV